MKINSIGTPPVSRLKHKQSFHQTVGERKTFRDKYNEHAGLYNTLAAITSIIIAGKLYLHSRKYLTFEQTLEKNGIQINNNIAVLKKNGEKFTGVIERKIKKLTSSKIERTRYNKGIIEEKTYTGKKGKEIKAYFYKDGDLLYDVGEIYQDKHQKAYATGKYSKGKLVVIGDAICNVNESVFENYRKIMKASIPGWGV